MGKAKIIKRQERCFIELPASFNSFDEIELFELRQGYYLLSVPLDKPEPAQKDSGPSNDEILILKKLSSIKFNERSPENVDRIFNADEKQLLEIVLKKGWASLFKGRKYKNGVYSIPERVYPLLRGKKIEAKEKPKEEKTEKQDPTRETLQKKGYVIVKDQGEAKFLSEKLKTEIKSKSIIGIKGFDGVFYLVTKEFIDEKGKVVLEFLQKEADVKAIAAACKMQTDEVNALLNHLAESGDIIEKKKGLYAAV
jgi:hypothetical protein